MSLNIKFPDEHYIGMVNRAASGDQNQLPLAFATPQGTDKAAEKRKSTVDTWVSQNSRSYNHALKQYEGREMKPTVVKNEAMAGFRLLDDVRRYSSWGSGNVKWRIEDPRGFELEITSPNLMQILSCTVVDKGEILDMCMWAREGSENILVPVSSEVYTTATENTERSKKAASLRDIKIGDHAVLLNGAKGRYFGKMNAVENDYSKSNNSRYSNGTDQPLFVKLTPRHVFVDYDEKTITIVASPKLSEIIPGDEMSKPDAELELAKLLAKKRNKQDEWTTTGGGYSTHAYTFSKVPPSVKREKVPVSLDHHTTHSAVFQANGTYYIANVWSPSDEIEGEPINTSSWENNALIIRSDPSGYHWNRTRYKFLKSDLKARGVQAFRAASRITTESGAVFVVQH